MITGRLDLQKLCFNFQVGQEEKELRGNKPVTGSVDIDATLGERISFIFHFEEELPYILIASPNGVTYGPDSSVYSVDDVSKVTIFHFQYTEV